jgi:hypothetical protein
MSLRRALTALAFLPLAYAPASARIDVTIDHDSLNGLLASMAPDHVEVSLAGGRSLTIQLKDLAITGFDPAAGPNGGMTASLRVVVPDLGLDLRVEPHLTLDISDTKSGRKASFLRFDKVVLNLPLTGPVDVAALLPPLALMPDGAWVVNAARGRVRVQPSLVDAKTGTKNIRLGFTLDLAPVDEK